MKTWIVILSFFSLSAMAQDRAEVPEVLSGYYLVATSLQYPAIQAYGIASCIAVTLFDGVNGVGAVMHVAGATDIPKALNIVLEEMKAGGALLENVHAQLSGGWDDSMGEGSGIGYASDRMLKSLKRELSRKHISYVEASTLVTKAEADTGANTSLNIELDLYTGQVDEFQPSISFSGGSVTKLMPENFQAYSF